MSIEKTRSRSAGIFAKRLATLRKERQLTQAELARRVGVSRGIVAYYESCDTNPSLDTLEKFADFFGVRIGELVEEPKSQESKPGPTSRLEQQMNQVRRLSAIQQRRLVNMIDAFLTTE